MKLFSKKHIKWHWDRVRKYRGRPPVNWPVLVPCFYHLSIKISYYFNHATGHPFFIDFLISLLVTDFSINSLLVVFFFFDGLKTNYIPTYRLYIVKKFYIHVMKESTEEFPHVDFDIFAKKKALITKWQACCFKRESKQWL